jgi:hypothetical protein
MLHVIELAKKQGLNIAITANAGVCSSPMTLFVFALIPPPSGKPPFYEKLGFQIIGDPIMIGPDNNIEGVSGPFLSLVTTAYTMRLQR